VRTVAGSCSSVRSSRNDRIGSCSNGYVSNSRVAVVVVAILNNISGSGSYIE